MNRIRRIFVLLLAVLMMIGAVMPAYADELENEDELIQAALAEQGADTETALDEPSEQPDEQPEAEKTETPAAQSDETVVPADGADEPSFVWQTPASADVDILSGGTMLSDGSAFYYVSDGIWCEVGGETRQLTSESGGNLNLYDGWLYYTSPQAVRRISLADGTVETVYDCAGIDQLYVIGRAFLYLADGCVYTYDSTNGALVRLDAPENTAGLIPTQYGNIYLTGDVFDRSVWVNGSVAFEGVTSCYTDSGYLVVNRDSTYQIALETLFAGGRELAAYSLHADMLNVPQMTDEEAMAAEAAYFESDQYAAIEALEEDNSGGVATYALDGAAASSVYITAQQLALSQDNMNTYNITRRARQQAEVEWTPLRDRYAWGARSYHAERTVTSLSGKTTNYFVAGETYRGIPYSWPLSTTAHPGVTYVGWQVSVSEFVGYVNDTGSRFYSGYSDYYQTAPYYGSDCAAFVSSAWNLPYRCTCSSLVAYSTFIGSNINQIQLGDCLNKTTEHVVLVTDIAYDYYGNIVSIEITQQTPLMMKVTNYGQRIPGKTNSGIIQCDDLSAVQRYYLNNGYYIYRRNYSRSVSYTPDNAVPLAEDGWLQAPALELETNADGTAILVTLSHSSGANIYYTTDGTAATTSSTLYTGAIAVTEETTIRAIADHSGTDATGCFELIYTVEAEKAAAPTLQCVSGALAGTSVQSGSYITLASDEGTTVYYTTDGSTPTLQSAKMGAEGISVTADMTLRAIAVAPDKLCSEVAGFALKVGVFHTVTIAYVISGVADGEEDSVLVLDGEDKELSFEASEGYRVGDVLVDGESVGAASRYTLRSVSADHSVQVKIVIDLPFTDVKPTSWYADEVAYAYTNGLFKGETTTTFAPNAYMTRGQFVTVLGRFAGVKDTLESFTTGTIGYTNGYGINIRKSASLSASVVGNISNLNAFVTVLGSTTDSSGAVWYQVKYGGATGYIKAYSGGKYLLNVYGGKFKDISGRYYNGYVQWAYYNGIVQGESTTSFGSLEYITRQDLCVILYNYMTKYCGKTLATGSKRFTDEASIRSYATTAVHALANAGIVQGYTDGAFQPNAYATRAEVATMFMNMANYLAG